MGSGEGDNSMYLGSLTARTQPNKDALVLSASVFSVTVSLLGTICSPGIPRNGRPHNDFTVLLLNTGMFYPAGIRKLTEPVYGLNSFSETLPSCGTSEL